MSPCHLTSEARFLTSNTRSRCLEHEEPVKVPAILKIYNANDNGPPLFHEKKSPRCFSTSNNVINYAMKQAAMVYKEFLWRCSRLIIY
ncbi:hypothetical protein PUN28_012998 [Cardiocondyla obscurior]|uniref:Uncharacterized protein n=1 Tax=Cardiocondyla obscurior TaxID=286306 RepID=A0AAW2FAG2_9HYME